MNARYPGLGIETATDRSPSHLSIGTRNAHALGAARWLSLAAAPTFALMALLTALLGAGPGSILCSAMPDASPLTGMIPMYLLMSAFHLAPWLKLIASRHAGRLAPFAIPAEHPCADG
jgi:hypothetical protein